MSTRLFQSYDMVLAITEGLHAALQAYERLLGLTRLSLEYGTLTRRERGELEGRIGGTKLAISHYKAALKVWAPSPLPSERRA